MFYTLVEMAVKTYIFYDLSGRALNVPLSTILM